MATLADASRSTIRVLPWRLHAWILCNREPATTKFVLSHSQQEVQTFDVLNSSTLKKHTDL